MANFPYDVLGVKVELLLNATWTDVTAYTYLRDGISISPFGRTNEASSMQAAQVALTFNNRTGRFSPGNSLGAYYPYVQLNTQVRISVNDTSSNGTAYSGYRFWGELTSLPVEWDQGARDVYVQVTASGIWRRLSQSTKRLGSPYTRYNSITVAGSATLASYWPMEDGATSAAPTSLANLVTTQGAMTVTSGTPALASCTAFPGSDAIPALQGAKLTGSISTSSHPTSAAWRFCMFVPTGGDTGTPSGSVLARWTSTGTIARIDLSLAGNAAGPLTITGFNSGGTQLFTASSTLTTPGVQLLVHVSLTQSGSNVNWAMQTILPGAGALNTTASGTVTTATVNDSTSVVFNVTGAYKGTAVGQCDVIYGTAPALTAAAAPLNAWQGEFAGARFNRICAEQNIAAVLTGSSSSGTTMGPQADDTLANVLQQLEATDGGQLFETRTQFGLGYRTLASMQNQSAAATVNYAAQQLSPPLKPVTDDTLTRNDVTLTNWDGYAVRIYLASGARSILAPPNGVGTGYEYTASVSSSSHTQVAALAQQLLFAGCVSDPRYPTVTVNLARTTTASLFSSVPSLGVGDYLALSNLPAYGGAASQKQLVWGWSETLGSKAWTITFNTIPEAPYETSFTPGTSVSGQVPASPTTASSAGSVSGGDISGSAVTLFSLSPQVLTYQFGGIVSTISSTAPTSPNNGDLWFDSGNGYQIKRWDAAGGTWVAVTFNGNNILGAGTITAGLLAANAVVAGNIAAGVVTATQLAANSVTSAAIAASVSITSPVITGGTITGGTVIADGTSGELLVYSGTPASGNLLVAVSGATGSDSSGNPYSTGLTLAGLSPDPTSISGSAILYGTSAGSLQCVDGLDGNVYQTQRLTQVLTSNVTSTSTTPSNIFLVNVGARSYRIYAWLLITANSNVAPAVEVAGPGSAGGQFSAAIARATTFYDMSNFGMNSLTGLATMVSGNSYVAEINGIMANSVAGSVAIKVGCATTPNSLTVVRNSFFDLSPI